MRISTKPIQIVQKVKRPKPIMVKLIDHRGGHPADPLLPNSQLQTMKALLEKKT